MNSLLRFLLAMMVTSQSMTQSCPPNFQVQAHNEMAQGIALLPSSFASNYFDFILAGSWPNQNGGQVCLNALLNDSVSLVSYLDMTVLSDSLPCDSLQANAGSILISCTTTSVADTIIGTTNLPSACASYQWTLNGVVISNSDTVIIQSLGQYVFTVTDNLTGCMASDTLETTDNTNSPIADAGSNLIFDCYNPTFVLDGSGSSIGLQFHYQWSGPGNFVSDSINTTANAPGDYLLTVTNLENGCTTTDMVLVQEDLILESPFNLFAIASDTCHANTGAIDFQYDGFPHTLIWSTGDTTSSISGLSAGIYELQVTFGVCMFDFTEQVDSIDCTSVLEMLGNLQLKISPNPNDGRFDIQLENISTISALQIDLLDVYGRNIMALMPMNTVMPSKSVLNIEVNYLPSGTYILRLNDGAKQASMRMVVGH